MSNLSNKLSYRQRALDKLTEDTGVEIEVKESLTTKIWMLESQLFCLVTRMIEQMQLQNMFIPSISVKI
jgi:hypothetical protein